MKLLARLLWKLAGWKLEGWVPEDINKSVCVAAPHTSNWDFFYGILAFKMMDYPVKFLIKKELFFWPLGPLLRALGGIAVDRKNPKNLVDWLAELYAESDQLSIVFAPEGTRKKVDTWKKGFYWLALKAEVPIILGFVNYRDKIGGVGPTIYPTGDVDKDLEKIMAFYRDIPGKYPEQGVS